MKPVIECKNISKIYGKGETAVHALSSVSFALKKGEIAAIMGPSGCGKSTLLSILGCLDKPTSGKVFIDCEDVSTLDENELAKIRGNKIGFVFQFFYLLPTLTSLKNVMLPMVFSGSPSEERAKELLKLIGLEHRMYHKPSQLSGGQRQRVAIARALANNPSIILADEPTGNLDSKSGNEIINLLININKKENITMLFVTHDPNIARFAHKIIFLKDGKIERIKHSKKKEVKK